MSDFTFEEPGEAGERRDFETSVGLCLSGGGFRAMLFHLGTLWRLNEVGWLPRLTRVASVSGGSITAGTLGASWGQLAFNDRGVSGSFASLVADPLLALASRTIDVPAVLLGPWCGGASRHLARTLDKRLFHGATLQDLPADGSGPRFIVLATNLGNGVLWRFSRAYMRDYLGASFPHPTLPLADAVAASSAFPPFLSPFRLTLPDRQRVTLTDGGVYDNLAVEPVVKRCRTIFVSDGGGPFPEQPSPARDWLFGTVRVLEVTSSQIARLRKRQVVGALASRRRVGAYCAIDADPSRFPHPAPALPTPPERTAELASLPTRFAALPTPIAHRLVNWGYAAADAVLRSYHDHTLTEPADFPLPDWV